MSKVLLVVICHLLFANIVFAQTTLFDQSFSGSSTVTDYIGSTGTTFFTDLTASSSTTVGINSGALEFVKAGTGSGRFVRNNPALNPSTQTLYIEFDLAVTASEATQLSAAVFYLGSEDGMPTTGFNNNGTVPENADVYCKLGFNFIGTSGGFQVRNVSGSANGATTVSDQSFHRITMIVNKSGDVIRYLVPGTLDTYLTLGSNKWQVYVDGIQQFASDLNPTTSARELSFMKFIFDGGIGSGTLGAIKLDNFRIRTVEGILPVSLTSFNAYATDKQTVSIQWQTAQERNSSHFIVERSADLQTFTTIAQLDAAGTTDVPRQYEFTDLSPLLSLNYYRLTQVDTDGTTQRYRPVAVRLTPVCSVYPNPSDGSVWQLELNDTPTSTLTVKLFSLLGNSYSTQIQPLGLNRWRVEPQSQIPVGCYVMSIQTDEKTIHQKVLVR